MRFLTEEKLKRFVPINLQKFGKDTAGCTKLIMNPNLNQPNTCVAMRYLAVLYNLSRQLSNALFTHKYEPTLESASDASRLTYKSNIPAREP